MDHRRGRGGGGGSCSTGLGVRSTSELCARGREGGTRLGLGAMRWGWLKLGLSPRAEDEWRGWVRFDS